MFCAFDSELDDNVNAGAAKVTAKLIGGEFAAKCAPSCAMVALSEHIPTDTKETRPVDEPTAQTEDVADAYVLDPEPADAVAVTVGGDDAIE